MTDLADPGSTLSSFDRSACQTHEVGSHMNEIMDSSKTKARTMVDAAMQVNKSTPHFNLPFFGVMLPDVS